MSVQSPTRLPKVVIDHVDDALHALAVDRPDEALEIRETAELGIDRAVVADRVGRTERALAHLFADGMDRHEPDDIGAERLDLVKTSLHGGKGAFFAEIADKYLIHDLIAQILLC